jgi:hypothetical protein
VVYKLVYLHSVFELSAVPILAWSGGGQNHDWTAPHHPCTQHSCSPQLGSVAQPQWTGQHRCLVIHAGIACTVCAQCRRGRGIAHLIAQQPKGRCVWALEPRSRSVGNCFVEKSVRRFVGIPSPIWGRSCNA